MNGLVRAIHRLLMWGHDRLSPGGPLCQTNLGCLTAVKPRKRLSLLALSYTNSCSVQESACLHTRPALGLSKLILLYSQGPPVGPGRSIKRSPHWATYVPARATYRRKTSFHTQ